MGQNPLSAIQGAPHKHLDSSQTPCASTSSGFKESTVQKRTKLSMNFEYWQMEKLNSTAPWSSSLESENAGWAVRPEHTKVPNTWGRGLGKRNALLHPSCLHKSTSVEDTSSSEVEPPTDKILNWIAVNLTGERCLQLEELPADIEPKRQQETLTAPDWTMEEPAESFQELLEERRKLHAAGLAYPQYVQTQMGKQLIKKACTAKAPHRAPPHCPRVQDYQSQFCCWQSKYSEIWSKEDPIWCRTTAAKSLELRSFSLSLQLQYTRIQYNHAGYPQTPGFLLLLQLFVTVKYF